MATQPTRLEHSSETLAYDDLHRLTSASRSWSGLPSPVPAEQVAYEYTNDGDLTQKSDFAVSYEYGSTRNTGSGVGGPHAARRVQLVDGTWQALAYDANGNLTSGFGRTVTFDAWDRPSMVDEVWTITICNGMGRW